MQQRPRHLEIPDPGGKAMRITRLGILAVALPLVVAGPVSGQGRIEKDHIQVVGVASASGGNCDGPIVEATVCRGWDVDLFKEGPPSKAQKAPWAVSLVLESSIVHPDGSEEPLLNISGYTTDIEFAFDSQHLRFASVRARVPMSDGSERIVNLRWDGTSTPLQVAGNNGPYNTARDIPPHFVNRCFTVNQHAHQAYRGPVELTGTIDGFDVRDIPFWNGADPIIARGNFTLNVVEHGGPSCEG